MLKKINLFPSIVYSYHIDPTLFDKKTIIDTVIKNYEKDSNRNSWSKDATKIHHYYGDWNNSNFENVPLESLTKLYLELFVRFVNEVLPLKETITKDYDIQFSIVNITVFKEQGQNMTVHDHMDSSFNTIFSAVHYLKVGKNTPGINFLNPLLYSSYSYQPIDFLAKEMLDNKNLDNTSFFNTYEHFPCEDEIIIFPAYLKHWVKPVLSNNEDYRIAIAANIGIRSV